MGDVGLVIGVRPHVGQQFGNRNHGVGVVNEPYYGRDGEAIAEPDERRCRRWTHPDGLR